MTTTTDTIGSAPAPMLPVQHMQLGGDPNLVADELLHIIAESITRQPRSLQKAIGPSEIGQACGRRIAHKLLGTPERTMPPAWKPTVGTAIHAHLESVFDAYNVANAHTLNGQERFLIETKVTVGQAGGRDICGTADLYDRITGTNWDWKTVGPTQLKKYKAHGPGQQYRVQAHLYGQGWRNAGLPLTHVGIVFLPRNGDLAEAVVWSEPFDPQVATDALNRLEGIQLAVDTLGPAAPGLFTPVDDYCGFCPFFKPGTQDLTGGCPGVEAAAPAPALTLN